MLYFNAFDNLRVQAEDGLVGYMVSRGVEKLGIETT